MSVCGYIATNTEAVTCVTSRVYKPDATKMGVLWAHYRNGSSLDVWSYQPHLLALCDALGLPLAAGNFGGATAWGNDGSQTKLSDARSYLASRFNAKTSRVVLVGISMGGLLCLNWARANPTLVACICLFYPAVNLQAQHDGTGGASAFAAEVEAAYGGAGPYAAAAAGHDPAQNASAYSGVPIKMWYSTADTVVGSANQTAFAAAVGGAFQSRSLGAATHTDMTVVDPAEVAGFVGQFA